MDNIKMSIWAPLPQQNNSFDYGRGYPSTGTCGLVIGVHGSHVSMGAQVSRNVCPMHTIIKLQLLHCGCNVIVP